MRISEAIEQLQAIQDAEGDIPVGLLVGEFASIEEADQIEVRAGHPNPRVEGPKMAFILP